MKYTTFVKLRAMGVASVVALGVWAGCRKASAPVAPPETTMVGQSVSPPLQAAQAPSDALTDADNYVLQQQKEPLSKGTSDGKSIKWRFKENGVTFEFRSDTNKGSKTWNRAKVDLNGNKKNEQQWTFDANGAVSRKVAPNDDENYTVTQRLDGDKWTD